MRAAHWMRLCYSCIRIAAHRVYAHGIMAIVRGLDKRALCLANYNVADSGFEGVYNYTREHRSG